jgi:hypothetical protein
MNPTAHACAVGSFAMNEALSSLGGPPKREIKSWRTPAVFGENPL